MIAIASFPRAPRIRAPRIRRARRSPEERAALATVKNISTEVIGYKTKGKKDQTQYPQILVKYDNGKGQSFSGVWDSRRPLLSANTKLKKLPGRAKAYRAIGLAIAPWRYGSRGNVCDWAGHCVIACNGLFAGMNNTPSTRVALIGRNILYWDFRALFLAKLRAELLAFVKLCKRTGRIPAVRLNVSSDIVWERAFPDILAIVTENGGVAYDYTKAPIDKRATLPPGYYLSHSFSEKTTFSEVCKVIDSGRNLIVAFDSAYDPPKGLFGALPSAVTFRCRETGAERTIPVFNADRHDIRIPALDGRGRIGGLHGKSGKERVERATDSGFFVAAGEDGKKLSRRLTTFGAPVVRVC
jgi:hypothetical protein